MYRLYTAGLAALLVAWAPRAAYRRLVRGTPVHLAERLGYGRYAGERRRSGWIHAVSVGEAMAAGPIVRGLRERRPDLPLVVTTVTETGARVVTDRLGEVAAHRFFPIDLPGAARRVLAALDPAFLICMETELWPNVLRESGARGVPVMIANGRLSDRSFRRYRLLRRALADVLRQVRVFAMQSAEDARRIVALGAPPERVFVTGNLKHDAAAEPAAGAERWQRLLGFDAGRRVWVAGSTHRGEDEAVLAAHRAACRRFPDLGLVIAPRHPERAGEVAGLVRAGGWPSVLRSALPGPAAPGAVVVLDSIGELADLYAIADVVFVGGSLVPAGGHNMLEPARHRKPVLFGPLTANFRDVAALIVESGGGFVVQDADDLAARLAWLLSDDDRRVAVGESGHAAVGARSGAARDTLELVERFLWPRVAAP